MNDVIIVGGGLAGLAAATLCARAGLRTKLIERANALGGRAKTEFEAGHAFNEGAHALYRGGPAATILRELGVVVPGRKPPTSGLSAIARGRLQKLPSGIVSLLGSDLLPFGAKVQTARALARIARTSPREMRALAEVSWRAWVARAVASSDAREVLDALARLSTYTNAPERLSAGAVIGQLKIAVGPGVVYVDGGWLTLVRQLEREARDAGVEISTGKAVAEVRAESAGAMSAVTVTRSDGERSRARAVVLAVGPAAARTILDRQALAADAIPVRAASLDVGLSSLPVPSRHFALGIDQPTYLSVHSATARVAERGATIHVMKYLDPDAGGDGAADARELEGVLDLVQPGWRDRLVVKRFLPSLVATNALVAVGSRRPGVEGSGTPGVYLAGDWVGEGWMLADAALSSAKAAAERAIARARVTAPTEARQASLAS